MVAITEDAGAVENVVVTEASEGAAAAETADEGDKPKIEEKEAEVKILDCSCLLKVSSIPSLVIEPASNNEGEGEEHEVIVNESKDVVEDVGTQGIESDTSELSQVVTEQKTIEEIQTTSSEEQPVSADDAAHGMPPGFLFKVEVLHDFEAANTDELNLKRGDTVLVIPSEATDDQEAGWLTGIKQSDWLQYRDAVNYKGLFPENFTKPLE
uniref:SH3 domain-containing protein n=1 Tax=Chelonoidis abingdonii TaxID=106734 RepID=A0A8C0GSQ6_CHEAB